MEIIDSPYSAVPVGTRAKVTVIQKIFVPGPQLQYKLDFPEYVWYYGHEIRKVTERLEES